MRTAIVILNWNTKEYLEKFLPGAIASAYDAEVVVADNASSDGSVEMMRERFPSVRTIIFDENYGFTGGYNRALDALKGEFEYYLLLNSDIEVPAGWLVPLVGYMDSHPECGACGPKLHSWYERDSFEYAGAAGGLMDSLGYPFCRGRVLGKVEKDCGQYDRGDSDVLWVTGACLMVRSSLWHSLGGLDSRFFAHQEEIDLCWRMQLNGYRVCVVPESVVYHLGGGTLPQTSPFKLKLNYRNNLLMLENNLALTYALRLFAGWGEDADEKVVASVSAKAVLFARLTLMKRMFLDGLSAAVYLLTFRPSYFRSVLSAHREYRKLRRKVTKSEVAEYLRGCGRAEVRGMVSYWMIPKAVLGLKLYNL